MASKTDSRVRRARRTRAHIKMLGKHRLCVHRTPRHIYAQVIAPNGHEVIASAATVQASIRKEVKYTGNADAAKVVGATLAKAALDKGVKQVAFDRSGFRFHGRVKALAEAAREAGLKF